VQVVNPFKDSFGGQAADGLTQRNPRRWCCRRALETPLPAPNFNLGGNVRRHTINHPHGGSLMYGSLFARDVFTELDRLQREVNSLFNDSPSIRGGVRWPALNVGSTDNSVEVYAFVPGLEPSSIDVSLDRGVLSIAGERKTAVPRNGNGTGSERQTLHLNERFDGRFRRVVSLPDDIDPNAVTADYRDGVLRVSVARRESAKPRRITVN
jgi:HSP20 family protein